MIQSIKSILRPWWHKLKRALKPRITCVSETSKCRARLAPYCIGDGVDLGFGGDPITTSAVRLDMPYQYGAVGIHPAQLRGSADNLQWFRDASLDYIYSSHRLEDFADTGAVLREWWRVLKPGGRLIIFCPDEQVYREHCARTGQYRNEHHIHTDFSLAKVKTHLDHIGPYRVLHEIPMVDAYSWDLVVEKS